MPLTSSGSECERLDYKAFDTLGYFVSELIILIIDQEYQYLQFIESFP